MDNTPPFPNHNKVESSTPQLHEQYSDITLRSTSQVPQNDIIHNNPLPWNHVLAYGQVNGKLAIRNQWPTDVNSITLTSQPSPAAAASVPLPHIHIYYGVQWPSKCLRAPRVKCSLTDKSRTIQQLRDQMTRWDVLTSQVELTSRKERSRDSFEHS